MTELLTTSSASQAALRELKLKVWRRTREGWHSFFHLFANWFGVIRHASISISISIITVSSMCVTPTVHKPYIITITFVCIHLTTIYIFIIGYSPITL